VGPDIVIAENIEGFTVFFSHIGNQFVHVVIRNGAVKENITVTHAALIIDAVKQGRFILFRHRGHRIPGGAAHRSHNGNHLISQDQFFCFFHSSFRIGLIILYN